MASNELLFQPDYGHPDPLWHADNGFLMPLDRLPLANATRTAIREWASRWEELAWQAMDYDAVQDGQRPGPAKPVPAGAFEDIGREGRVLCQALREELGSSWRVGYVSFSTGKRHVEWPNTAKP